MSSKRCFSKEELEQVVLQSSSYAEVCRKLGYPNRQNSIVNLINKYEISTAHFKGQGWNKNNFDYTRFQKGKVLRSGACIKALVAKRGYRCQKCGNSKWLNGPINLEIHHVDGDRLNNVESNLVLLCPNCHALTENYRGRNIDKHSITYISEDIFVEALLKYPNIRQALLALGLSARGGNYVRARELIVKYNIQHLLEP